MGKGNVQYKSKGLRLLVSLSTLFLPQFFKRFLLNKLLGYSIHATAKIGLSLIYPKHLEMGAHSRIGNLSYCKGLSLFSVGKYGVIGNLNWITAVPIEAKAFRGETNRMPQLKVGDHAAITNRHLIDCCNSVEIGRFSTFAGFRSQILTHAIDLKISQQRTAPVLIGNYCFVGSNVVILSGSKLPNFCVLGASACLTAEHTDEYTLYAGVPAKPVKKLPANLEYFKRKDGFVL